jgi:uncharacterized protein YukE
MSQWDERNPGRMDRDGVQGLVYRCAEHLAVLAEQTDRVDRLVATTGEGWTGQAADTWRQNATDLATRIRDLDPALRSGAQALDDYAMTVASIAARAQIVSADLDAARAGAARARADLTRLRSGTDADEGDLRHARYLVSAREDEQDNATLLLARLAEERRCADQILTARLRAAVPAAWADSGGLAGTLDPGVFRGEAIDLSAVGLWALALEALARRTAHRGGPGRAARPLPRPGHPPGPRGPRRPGPHPPRPGRRARRG